MEVDDSFSQSNALNLLRKIIFNIELTTDNKDKQSIEESIIKLNQLCDTENIPFVYLFDQSTLLTKLCDFYFYSTNLQSFVDLIKKCLNIFSFENLKDSDTSISNILKIARSMNLSLPIKRDLNGKFEEIYSDLKTYHMMISDDIFNKAENLENYKDIIHEIAAEMESLKKKEEDQFKPNLPKNDLLNEIFNEIMKMISKILEGASKTNNYYDINQDHSDANLKAIEKFNNSMSFLEKNDDDYINGKEIEISTDPRFKTHFILNEFLHPDENLEIEYKNYEFPLNDCLREHLRKVINAFLNTNGGRIYIGVTDQKIVKGVRLDCKQKDILNNDILNLVRNFYPSCRINNLLVKFIPIKNNSNMYIRDLWIVKIIVKQGDSYQLYSVDDYCYKSYLRQPGQCILLTASEICDEIKKRCFHSKEQYPDSNFVDPEPEVIVPSYNYVNQTQEVSITLRKRSKHTYNNKYYTIKVSSLPRISKKDLLDQIEIVGYTKFFKIYTNHKGICQGIGFLNFDTLEQAELFQETYQNYEIAGQKIKLNLLS